MAKSGKEYEKIVAEIHEQFAGYATVTSDEKIVGKSGETRQIDVSLRSNIVGTPILIIIECKDYGRKVEVGKVDELIGKMTDVGANSAVLMSDSGFTNGALKRALAAGNIQLCSVVDSNNKKLRAAVRVPMIVGFLEVTFDNLQFQISKYDNTFERGYDDDGNRLRLKEKITAYAPIFLRGVQDHLNHRYQNNPIPGPGTYRELVSIGNGNEVTLIFNYTLSIEVYVNDKLNASGRGIYSHIDKKMTVGQLDDITLGKELLRSTWESMPYDFKPHPPREYITRVSTVGDAEQAIFVQMMDAMIDRKYS